MIVPTPIPYPSIPPGGVMSNDLVHYYMKSDDTHIIHLDTGAVEQGNFDTQSYTYFPTATLVLGV